MPATRTLNGPIGYSEFSWVGAGAEDGGGGRRGEHRHRGAAKATVPPAAAPILAAGKAGNGVPATTAA